MLSIKDINEMPKEEFVQKIGWVFENTPWISEIAWDCRPFQSVHGLHNEMVQIVKKSKKNLQLELIRAHPDLGARIKMHPSSVNEQKGAGLDQLTEEEYRQFQDLNQTYVDTFGFPFILAVKGHNKETIYAAMKDRIDHSQAEEFETALQEIYKISLFRLQDAINEVE
ncbi:2-oxo-4-hydroxy-4-carboxy-5-ureidoimidazoline decarboxylase [Bacillus sp. 03113]|uniref:2-oxo-4-hydroxy-4-carboxy-5-ureidoimidazoline decarboxylase n=1 Tax=Bacillus sp. 03113 TaxID=2578211 RepID=UPI001142EFFD|nr:2-oxo-4-hydroxy-4-carboxy-5-ureidoimidazoline decarboxylase [Bacillus sp. 03113]